tara:strand:+ start:277 stop:915 length:639 start_codon:yes stop_codon:yes gene_type:complete
MGCITSKPENTGYQYILAYRFPDGEAKDTIMELSKIIGGQVYNGYKARNESPHFTLKYIFVATKKQLKELVNSLEQFARNNKHASAWLSGVNKFPDTNRVVFVEQIRSKEATELVESLTLLLNTFEWMQWDNVDNRVNGPKPHSTVFLDDKGIPYEKFEKLVKHFGNKNIEFSIDNICISRHKIGEKFTGYMEEPGLSLDQDNIWKKFILCK